MSRVPLVSDPGGLQFGEDDSATHIIHVDMDAFYASVELIDRPELRGTPVIIGGMGGRGVVLSATYEARALGVHAAMPMATAQRLAPSAVVIRPRHDRYAEVSAGVMEIFRSITPEVEPLSLDEAFLDVAAAIRRLGRPRDIATMIRQRVWQEQHITCSVGIAANKFLAKLASTAIKPNGLLLVPPQHVIDFLHPLPVNALWGVGPKTAEQLTALGLKTVADIAHTPRETLLRTLGEAQGMHLYELAWGRDEREVVSQQREKSLGNETTFAYDTDDLDVILSRLRELCDSVAYRLRKHEVMGSTVVLKLRMSDFKTVSRSVTLPAPVDTAHEIYSTIKRSLLAYMTKPQRVRLVGVRVENLCAASEAPAQLELGQVELRWRDAEIAMDAAHQRFGKGAITSARTLSSDDKD